MPPGPDRAPSGLLARAASTNCHSSCFQRSTDVDFLQSVLYAAEKYEMPAALAALRLALFSPFLSPAPSPLRLYGIAWRMSWEREAQHAAARTLALDLLAPDVLPELVRLEPAPRERLVALHRARRDALWAGLDDPTAFYANLRVTACNRNDGQSRCAAVLDHGAWFAFKYALARRLEGQPVGVDGFDEGFYQMREFWDLRMAHCVVCKRIVYNMPNTLENLQKIVRELPKTVEVRVPCGCFLLSCLKR